MLLVLVRHGPAGDRAAWSGQGRPDGERPLTEDGRKKTRRDMKGLRTQLPGLDLLAASPLLRARQTADILHKRFPRARRSERAELMPSAGPQEAARWLQTLKSRTVAAVGHEPHLSRLAALLLAGRREPFTLLKKGGVAIIAFPGACRPASGTLEALLPPKALRRLA
ncbi:MAG: histidine phosphatase family protein [Elusimicrobia bacterium]|nr:histidine phosphatase family protein [Elusimicrobiota bacterium]